MKLIPLNLLLLLFSVSINAQNKELNEVTIQSPYSFSKKGLNTTSLSLDKINSMPFISISEVVSNISNVNIQSRGFYGAQADISIRGGSFEQVGIFMNGIRINDPQTGHNQMNLPFQIQDIGSIEVLKTSSSKLLGQSAYSGALLFTTRVPEKNSLSGSFSYGNFYSKNAELSTSLVTKNTWHRLSLGFSDSKGYRHNTDFKYLQLFTENHFMFGSAKKLDAHLTFGTNSKEFGSNGFYSLKFPNQYEETQTYFTNVGLHHKIIKLDLYWRQSADYYVLKKENPAFYKNIHYTDVLGAIAKFEKSLLSNLKLFSTLEFRNEKINSTRIGNHERNIINLNINAEWEITNKLHTDIGGNINWIDGFAPFYTGGINISYAVNDKLSIYTNGNRAFRIPTFTELYYTSPTDSGNAKLSAESAYSLDLGYKFKTSNFKMDGCIYYRTSDNQIDWVKPSSTASYYRSQNFSNIQTLGFELNTHFNLGSIINIKQIKDLSIVYAYNNLTLDSSSLTKYSYNVMVHQMIASIEFQYTKHLSHFISFRLEDRGTIQALYPLLDSRIEYKLSDEFKTSFFISAQNITDTKYQNFPGIPMPGALVMGGFKFRL